MINKIDNFDELNNYCYFQFSTLAESRSYLTSSMNKYLEKEIQSRYKKAYKDIQQQEKTAERAERKLARQERRQAFIARLKAFFGFKVAAENNVSSKIAEQTETKTDTNEPSGDGATLNEEATQTEENVSS